MKLKNIPTSNLAAIIALMQDASPGLTAENLISAIRLYEPDKPAIQKTEPLKLLTIPQFAERLSVSRGKIFQLVKDGKIKRILLGKRTARIAETELSRFFEMEVGK